MASLKRVPTYSRRDPEGRRRVTGHVRRARYRQPDGKEVKRDFKRKVDGRRFLDEATAGMVTGQYVNPRAGQVTLRDDCEDWRMIQVHRPSSAAHYETMLRRHVYPHLGEMKLADITPSVIQAWVRRISETLAPSTVSVLHGIVSSYMKAAVRDRRIASNPCARNAPASQGD